MNLCEHTCRGLCKALDIAIEQESQSIMYLRDFLDVCDYPDIKVLLKEIIDIKEKNVILLKDKAEEVRTRFNMLDQIGDGYESE